jgi:anti-sigma B factor antagonist
MSKQANFTVQQPSKEVLVLGGEMDLSNAPRVKPLLDEWLGQRLPSYTLDLRPLQRIDSSGLGLVVGAYRNAITQEEPKASFKLKASGSVLRVIRLIGLDRVLPVEGEE